MRVRFGDKAFRTGVRQPIDWAAGGQGYGPR